MAALTRRTDIRAGRCVKDSMHGGVPHFPLRVIRTHVALGADFRIFGNGRIGQVIAVTAGAAGLDLVTPVAPERSHLAALLKKPCALHVRHRQGASVLVAEAAFARIAILEIAGTPPSGMQPEAVPTPGMLLEFLGVAAPAHLGVDAIFSGQHPVMIGSVAIGTADPGRRMVTLLPLRHGSRGDLAMACPTVRLVSGTDRYAGRKGEPQENHYVQCRMFHPESH